MYNEKDDYKFLDELNDQQKEAVLEIDRPLYIIAGAGTGKTKTLTAKVCYLIKSGVRPKNILTLTFTNKAANEMKERIIKILEKENLETSFLSTPWFLNFHKFGIKILRSYIHLLENGFSNQFTIIDEEDLYKIVLDLMKNNLDEKVFKLIKNKRKIITKIFYEYKNHQLFYPDIDFSLQDKLLEKDIILNEEICLKLYYGLLNYLKVNDLLYFDDILIYAYQLLKENEAVRESYEKLFEYILVDEFQDTDTIQFEILKLLRKANKKIFVVGDPNQSIYSFRGANFLNNKNFLSYFNAKKVYLYKNYRSTNHILNASNNLIRNNNSDSVNLKSDLGDGYKPSIRNFVTDDKEVEFILTKIKYLLNQGIKPSDIAILYRSNHLSKKLEQELLNHHIPYQVYGGVYFFERKEIKDIIAYLALILGFEKPIYIQRVINIPKRGIGDKSNEIIIDLLSQDYSLKDIYEKKLIDSKLFLKFEEFYLTIKQARDYLNNSNDFECNIIDFILKDLGYENYLNEEYPDNYIDRVKNVLSLNDLISSNYKKTKDRFLSIFKSIEDISLNLEEIKKDKNENKDNLITISTVHQVKGLEYKVIFIYAVNDRLFPTSDENIEEERRIFYVALTRAKFLLYITYSDYRYVYGTRNYYTKSNFIEELEVEKIDNKKQKYSFLNIFNKTQKQSINLVQYEIGQRVFHEKNGMGYVIYVDDKFIVISFDLNGNKKFLKTTDSIKIIKEKLN